MHIKEKEHPMETEKGMDQLRCDQIPRNECPCEGKNSILPGRSMACRDEMSERSYVNDSHERELCVRASLCHADPASGYKIPDFCRCPPARISDGDRGYRCHWRR